MRDWVILATAVLLGFLCGCPRQGEPPVASGPEDLEDAGEADPGADVADAAAATPADAQLTTVLTPASPPRPLAASFRAVPRIGHAGPVWAVPLADDRILGIDAGGFAKWWSGLVLHLPARLLRSVHLGVAGLTAVAFAGPPGERRVVLGTADGRVLSWSVPAAGAAFEPPRRVAGPLPRAVSSLAVTADGRRIAVATVDGAVRVLDAGGSEQWVRDRDHGDNIPQLAISPDGSLLAGACADGVASVWETASGRRAQILAHDGPVVAAAFSPDGRTLATGTSSRSVHLWTLSPFGAAGRRDGFPAAIERLAYTVFGQLYAADERGEIFVLDATTLDGSSLADASLYPCSGLLPHRCLVPREGRLRSLGVDDSNLLVAGGEDGAIRTLAVAEGDRGTSPAAEVVPFCAATSPGGEVLAVGLTDGTIVRLDAATGRERARRAAHGDAVTALRWLGPEVLASGSLDGTLKVWKGTSATPEQTFADHRRAVTALALSADGAHLASGGADGAVIVWDVADDGRLRFAATLDGPVSRVLALAFSADGTFLYTAGLDRTVQKWNVARHRGAWSRPIDMRLAPTGLAVLPGGRLLAGMADGSLRRIGPGRDWVRLAAQCAGPVLGFAAPGGADEALLVGCGDGVLRRLEGSAATAPGEWAGEPFAPAGDATGSFVVAEDGTSFVCGEAVSALGPEGGAPRWRTWFVPGGSLTLDGEDRYFASGAGASAVSYADGSEARDLDDPAVRLKNGGSGAGVSQ